MNATCLDCRFREQWYGRAVGENRSRQFNNHRCTGVYCAYFRFRVSIQIQPAEQTETGDGCRADGDAGDLRALCPGRTAFERCQGLDSTGRAADHHGGLPRDAELAGGDEPEGPRDASRAEASGAGAAAIRTEGGRGHRCAGLRVLPHAEPGRQGRRGGADCGHRAGAVPHPRRSGELDQEQNQAGGYPQQQHLSHGGERLERGVS